MRFSVYVPCEEPPFDCSIHPIHPRKVQVVVVFSACYLVLLVFIDSLFKPLRSLCFVQQEVSVSSPLQTPEEETLSCNCLKDT